MFKRFYMVHLDYDFDIDQALGKLFLFRNYIIFPVLNQGKASFHTTLILDYGKDVDYVNGIGYILMVLKPICCSYLDRKDLAQAFDYCMLFSDIKKIIQKGSIEECQQ